MEVPDDLFLLNKPHAYCIRAKQPSFMIPKNTGKRSDRDQENAMTHLKKTHIILLLTITNILKPSSYFSLKGPCVLLCR